MNFYDVQTRVRLSVEFVDQASGNHADPGNVILFVEDPDGQISTYDYEQNQVVRSDVGKYQFDVHLRKIGRWTYQYQGIGSVEITTEAITMQVRETPFVVPP